MSNIIERLRAQASYDRKHYPPAHPLWTEAADRIEDLERDLLILRSIFRVGEPDRMGMIVEKALAYERSRK